MQRGKKKNPGLTFGEDHFRSLSFPKGTNLGQDGLLNGYSCCLNDSSLYLAVQENEKKIDYFIK